MEAPRDTTDATEVAGPLLDRREGAAVKEADHRTSCDRHHHPPQDNPSGSDHHPQTEEEEAAAAVAAAEEEATAPHRTATQEGASLSS